MGESPRLLGRPLGPSRAPRHVLRELPAHFRPLVGRLIDIAAKCGGDPVPVVEHLRRLGAGTDDDRGATAEMQSGLPRPGTDTIVLWELLAAVAAVDLAAVRTVEPHLDALAILSQAGAEERTDGVWGVYAAEANELRLEAHAMERSPDTVRLSGIKPWCSLAYLLDHALVTAHLDGERGLFAVDLRQSGVTVDDVEWSSRGLARIVSGPVRFDRVPGRRVGENGWYLERPGFAWGGGGVAACWFGGAVGLYRDLTRAAASREPDQLMLAWLGRAERRIRLGKAVLREAATRIDAGAFDASDALALRGTIVDVCNDLLELCAQALGPGALAFDEQHARRVADLAMYIQQHHAVRDDVEIGRRLRAERAATTAATTTTDGGCGCVDEPNASTPAFSHLEDGTDPSAWDLVQKLAPITLEALAAPDAPLIVVAPHPDDETLGAGGLVATAIRSGRDVHIILCTDGEASHPTSLTHAPQRLAKMRRAEFSAAVAHLGAGPTRTKGSVHPVALGLADGSLSDHVAPLEAAIRDLATPGSIIVAPLREDGHPDHAAAGSTAARVAADIRATLLEYPIWYWHWASPDTDASWRTMRTHALDATAAAAKRTALRAYGSQTRPLSDDAADAPVLSASFLQHFDRPVEIVRVSPGPARDSTAARATFNAVFSSDPDPWNFEGDYEQRKRAITLASLPNERYGTALELGCATGVHTAALVERCDRIVAVDASDVALERARQRLDDVPDVEFECLQIPAEWPRVIGADLVVFSEIGYFLTRAELVATFERIERSVTPEAHILLCHWLHPVEGWTLDGDTVHGLAHDRGWRALVTHREDDFVLEVFSIPNAGEHRHG